MKIGIMSAMQQEVSSLLHEMVETVVLKHGGRDYYAGVLHGVPVILVFSKWGTTAAASTATTLIERFQPDFIVFTGVAGAIDPSLNRGDIVIGDRFLYHDMDAQPLYEKFTVPLDNQLYYQPEAALFKKALLATQQFMDSIKLLLSPSLLDKFEIHNPKLLVGLVATGNKFISNQALHANLAPEGENVAATDMESTAVLHVCQDHNTPCVIIRTISDKADETAPVDFIDFVEEVATIYASHIIKNLFLIQKETL